MLKYSVLMSLYVKEKPEYLKQSIQSMLDQSVNPDEILIVKDGSLTLELENVLNQFVDKYPQKMRIVESKDNIGLGLALNLGIANCRNEIIARMDTDDISLPLRCEKQLSMFLMDKDLVICGTMVDEFNDDPKVIISSRVVPTTHNEIYEYSKCRSAFNHPTVMYKKSKVLEVGGYSNLRRNQDVDLFGRMLHSGSKAANINESLLLFRSNNDLLKRRKSWENTKSYILTIIELYKIGHSKITDVFIVSIAQLIMFLCPLKIQSWVYKKILRKV